jgi:dienelactone hydrolase
MESEIRSDADRLPKPSLFEADGRKFDVYRIGEGAPVILMHEITGMTPELIALGYRIAAQNFTVYLPHFFGLVGKRDEAAGFFFCLRRELTASQGSRQARSLTGSALYAAMPARNAAAPASASSASASPAISFSP